jgi:hypothetical protein
MFSDFDNVKMLPFHIANNGVTGGGEVVVDCEKFFKAFSKFDL